MTNQPKQWKSYHEQLALLKMRGMMIPDEKRALDFLARVGYYRLSGYYYPFRRRLDDKSRADDFMQGSHFDMVIELYLFDRKLRLLALDAIEHIELAMQSSIAYLLGARDVFAHENVDILHPNFAKKKQHNGKTQYENWLRDYESLLDRNKSKPFIHHYIENYERLPIWVAVEIWNFGTMSKFFAGLRIGDKIALEKRFGLNEGKHLQTWLRSLNFIRNIAAHHARLWNCRIKNPASIPNSKLHLRDLDTTLPFVYFCIMKKMLDVIYPESKWGERFKSLIKKFPVAENGAIHLNDMGLKDGWKDWSIWE